MTRSSVDIVDRKFRRSGWPLTSRHVTGVDTVGFLVGLTRNPLALSRRTKAHTLSASVPCRRDDESTQGDTPSVPGPSVSDGIRNQNVAPLSGSAYARIVPPCFVMIR